MTCRHCGHDVDSHGDRAVAACLGTAPKLIRNPYGVGTLSVMVRCDCPGGSF